MTRLKDGDKALHQCWKVTHDESIEVTHDDGGGVEVVSRVLCFSTQSAKELAAVCARLAGAGLATNQSTGLHVHIGSGLSFFSDEEVLRIYKAYLKYEPALNELLPSWRLRGGSSYKFCQDNREWVMQKFEGLVDTDASLFEAIDTCGTCDALWEQLCPEHDDRYVKMNIRNIHSSNDSRTFEFRQCSGEIEPVAITCWVQLLACLVMFATQSKEITPMPAHATVQHRLQDLQDSVICSTVGSHEIGLGAWFHYRLHQMKVVRRDSPIVALSVGH